MPANPNPEALAPLVLFDLDGTLLDSAHDLHAAASELQRRKSQAPIAFDAFRPVVSKGSRAMLRASFPDHDDTEREALVGEFLDIYAQQLARHSELFEGVEALLAHIEAAGARWGIVTNKPFYLAEPLVEKLGWCSRSAILLGGDSLPRRKPDPDQLLHACERLSVAPSDTIYVGDDERDIQAARAAGMRSIAALWGYRPLEDDPRNWQADAMAECPRDLIDLGLLRA